MGHLPKDISTKYQDRPFCRFSPTILLQIFNIAPQCIENCFFILYYLKIQIRYRKKLYIIAIGSNFVETGTLGLQPYSLLLKELIVFPT